jgi:hypothetical protein
VPFPSREGSPLFTENPPLDTEDLRLDTVDPPLGTEDPPQSTVALFPITEACLWIQEASPCRQEDIDKMKDK